MAVEPKTWTLAEAKTHFSEVFDRALHDGPQTVTRRGKDAVIVVAADEWTKETRRHGTLSEFFRNSPLYGSGIDLERIHDEPPELDL